MGLLWWLVLGCCLQVLLLVGFAVLCCWFPVDCLVMVLFILVFGFVVVL